ncbi:MAG: sensor histidine kinase, partial [Gaiellales bacterium]
MVVATAATVLIAVGLTLVVGALLVRRAAQAQVLANLGRQADLIAARAAGGNVASAQLFALRRSLLRQGERVTLMPAGALPDGQGRRGSSLYAARTVGGRSLVLSRPAALRAADWHPFVRGFLLAGGVGVALAALASLLVARAIALPVTRVARASQALAAGEQPDPVPETGSGELAVLAASFNRMAVQLAGAREAERTFLMSVSHELRTPLTAIRGYAEGLADGAVEPAQAAAVIERESGRLERLVSDLLQLARLERRSSFSVRREPVDLGAVVTDVVSRYQAQARELGVGLAAEGDGVAQADTDRAVQVVSNL